MFGLCSITLMIGFEKHENQTWHISPLSNISYHQLLCKFAGNAPAFSCTWHAWCTSQHGGNMLKPSNNSRVIYGYLLYQVASSLAWFCQSVTVVYILLCGTLMFSSDERQLRAGRNGKCLLGTSGARKALGEGPLGNWNHRTQPKPKEFSQKDVKRKGSTKSHDIATSWLVEMLIQESLDDIRRCFMSFEAWNLNCTSKQWQPWETSKPCFCRQWCFASAGGAKKHPLLLPSWQLVTS